MNKKSKTIIKESVKINNFLETENEIIIFDTETTGLSAETDTIIQISALKLRLKNKEVFKIIDTLDIYIKPKKKLSPIITEITGYTNDFFKDKPKEEDVFDTIYEFFGECPNIGAYNSNFDVKMTRKLYERNGKEFKFNYEIDVLRLAKDLISKEKTENYKLCTIAHLANIDVDFHNSAADTEATTKLFQIFIHEYNRKNLDLTKKNSDDMNTKKDKTLIVKKNLKVKSIRYWQGFRDFSRIYVLTDIGEVYYDIRKSLWVKNNEITDEIDFDNIELQCFTLYNVKSITELINLLKLKESV